MPQIRTWRRALSEQLGSRKHLKRTSSLAIVALGATVLLAVLLPRPVSAQNISACGASIDIRFDNDSKGVTNDILLNWVERASTAVCTYYGKFPVPQLKLQ